MSQKLCAKTCNVPGAVLRLSLLGTLVMAAVAAGNTGCEDKHIGRTCDVLTPYEDNQAVYNSQALECPSRICLKPVQDQTAPSLNPPTGPFCSASCSQDSDCTPFEQRSNNDPTDRHCSAGFTCGIAFVKGPLCCQKLCICKDFLPLTGLPSPVACEGNGADTCYVPGT
jgi:hypothetical protein